MDEEDALPAHPFDNTMTLDGLCLLRIVQTKNLLVLRFDRE
jgi:hypothetical protein